MTTEYTPTTEDIRFGYAMVEGMVYDEAEAEFDRWLAAHDREVEERVVVRIAENQQNLWREP